MSKDDEGKESSLVSSWLGRSVLTAALAAEIAVRLAAGPFRRLLASPDQAKQLSESNREAIARRLLGTLGQLKGAAMKLGQMASYMNIGLPENVRKILEDLQDNVSTIDAKQIERVVKEDLGKAPQQIFAGQTLRSPLQVSARFTARCLRTGLLSPSKYSIRILYEH